MQIIFLEKNYEKNWGGQKPVGSVSASQDWSKKTSRQNKSFLEKNTFCGNTPK